MMDISYWIVLVLYIFSSAAAAIHALLYKRDSVAAFGWVAVSLGYPFFGPVLYFLFGINRTTRQARRKRALPVHGYDGVSPREKKISDGDSTLVTPAFQGLARLGYELSDRHMVAQNQVTMLFNGNEAYPVMLNAIQQAQHYILLTTYIFETNDGGKAFIEALGEAKKRNVAVKIIIDGIGQCYSWPFARKLLKQRGIEAQVFSPPQLFPPNISINLRCHRKLLVVDGIVAFAGGMNIGGRHMLSLHKKSRGMKDIQFQLTGNIVQQCEDIFKEDWHFVTKNKLFFPKPAVTSKSGTALCRAIEDGPNEYLGRLSTLIVNAVAIAQDSIWIMNPYFLPSLELTNALQAAALRGVEVNILLPEKNNLAYVQWASIHMLPRLVSYGVNIYLQPSPFVHSKLFIVDSYYVLLGSANLDPRSLRLNFEIGIEVYDQQFATQLIDYCEQSRVGSRLITLEELENLPFLQKIRNALFWLFYPYL